MVLLHGIVKKTQKTPDADLDLAEKRMKQTQAWPQKKHLSAAELRRLLDPDYMGVSLKTMFRAAAGLGLRIHIELVENQRPPAR